LLPPRGLGLKTRHCAFFLLRIIGGLFWRDIICHSKLAAFNLRCCNFTTNMFCGAFSLRIRSHWKSTTASACRTPQRSLPAVKICRIKIEPTCNLKNRYVAAPGNADSFREEGIKIHSKLDFKYFDSPDPAVRYRGVYAKGNIKNGIK
jgi:hypothetical protein